MLRRFPFTLMLRVGEPTEEPAPLRLKIDPGSQTTGLALLNDTTGQVVCAAEITHRGQQVQARREQRHRCRRSRRAGWRAVRATGSCTMKTARGTAQGIHWTSCQPLQRGDGYTDTKGAALPPPGLKAVVSAPQIQ